MRGSVKVKEDGLEMRGSVKTRKMVGDKGKFRFPGKAGYKLLLYSCRLF